MLFVFDIREAQLDRVGVSVYANNVIPKILEILGNKHKVILIGQRKKKLPFVVDHNVTYYPIAPTVCDNKIIKLLWYIRLPFFLHRMRATLYFGTFINIIPFWRMQTKVITTLHDAASLTTNGLVGNKISRIVHKLFVHNSIKNSSKIICISEYCKKEFILIFGQKVKEKGEVVYHGVPNDFSKIAKTNSLLQQSFSEKYQLKSRFLVTVGTITPKKNYIRLIEAFEKSTNKDFDLVIIGAKGFEHEKILQRASQSPKSSSIRFLHSINTEELVCALRDAEYFIFPSLYEGFGLPVLEAFQVGTPVLCSNATCLPEIAGDAALYFDPKSSWKLTQLISSLPLSTKLQEQMVEAGKARATKFSWALSARLHIKVFENALGKKLI